MVLGSPICASSSTTARCRPTSSSKAQKTTCPRYSRLHTIQIYLAQAILLQRNGQECCTSAYRPRCLSAARWLSATRNTTAQTSARATWGRPRARSAQCARLCTCDTTSCRARPSRTPRTARWRTTCSDGRIRRRGARTRSSSSRRSCSSGSPSSRSTRATAASA